MKRSRMLFVLGCITSVLVSQSLVGCGNPQTPTSSAADIKAFKGGPMPASAAKIMAQKMREANAPRPAPAVSNH